MRIRTVAAEPRSGSRGRSLSRVRVATSWGHAKNGCIGLLPRVSARAPFESCRAGEIQGCVAVTCWLLTFANAEGNSSVAPHQQLLSRAAVLTRMFASQRRVRFSGGCAADSLCDREMRRRRRGRRGNEAQAEELAVVVWHGSPAGLCPTSTLKPCDFFRVPPRHPQRARANVPCRLAAHPFGGADIRVRGWFNLCVCSGMQGRAVSA